jgi:hypothetical protein
MRDVSLQSKFSPAKGTSAIITEMTSSRVSGALSSPDARLSSPLRWRFSGDGAESL